MFHPARYDCFLTCAAADVRSGRMLSEELSNRGWRVFLADDALGPGEFRDDALPVAQQSSRLTVALVSPRSGDDYELRAAIADGMALARQRKGEHRVVPVMFDGVRLPFAPFAEPSAVIDGDRLGTWHAVSRALDGLLDGGPVGGAAGLLVDALLKVAGSTRLAPIDTSLVADTARAIGGPGDGVERARGAAAVFARALEHHPPTAVRLLRTLAEGPELAAGTPFGTLDLEVLRDACVDAWRAHPIDDADCWASWAAWRARDPQVGLALGVDPIERARAVSPRGDGAWRGVWRRLWNASPGHAGLAADAGRWLEARRRSPELWVQVWEELLAGLERAGDRAVLLLLGARWLRGRSAHPGWPIVWRTLVSEPGTLPIGVDRDQLVRLGWRWLDDCADPGAWVDVWRAVLDAADDGRPAVDRRTVLDRGHAALTRHDDADAWARLWTRLLRADDSRADALVDVATDWLLNHEGAAAWATVWLGLLDHSPPADPERARLLGWGRSWLAEHPTLPTWPVVLERLLEDGVRDRPVLEQAAGWLADHHERPVLAARLLTLATAAVPCDGVAAGLAAWLHAHPDDRRAEVVYAALTPLAWDGVERDGWGPGWRALGEHEAARRAAEEQIWDRLSQAAADRVDLEARVLDAVKGGLTIDLGVPAFMPASQIERGVVHDRRPYIGRRIECRIIRFDRGARRLVVSRVAVLDARRDHLLATLAPDDWVGGVVKRLEKFGAFVDLGGLDGLVHVTELDFGHVRHPADRLRVGQAVRVRVSEVDREKGRVNLSLKDPTRDPWLRVPARYRPGDWATGRVAHITHYGAFVELEPGVDGLIHLTEMSWARRPSNPSALVRKGEELRVRVVSIDLARRRLTLSRLDPKADPWRRFARAHSVGQTLSGRVDARQEDVARVVLDGSVTGELRPAGDAAPGHNVRVRVAAVDPGERFIALEPG